MNFGYTYILQVNPRFAIGGSLHIIYTKTSHLQATEDEVRAIASDKINITSKTIVRKLDSEGNIRIRTEVTATVDTNDVDKALNEKTQERRRMVAEYNEIATFNKEHDKRIAELRQKISVLPKDFKDKDLAEEQARLDRIFLSKRKITESHSWKDKEKAMYSLREAIRLNPKNDEAYSALGTYLYDNQKRQLELGHMAVVLNPSGGNYYMFTDFYIEALLREYSSADEFEKAQMNGIKLATRAIENAPDDFSAWFNRAMIYQYEMDDSVVYPTYPNIRIKRGGKYDKQIISDLTKCVELDPAGPPFILSGCFALAELGNYGMDSSDASHLLGIYEEEIRHKPNEAILYYNRSAIYKYLQKYEPAISDLSRAIGLTDDIRIKENIYLERSSIYKNIQDYNHAIEDLTNVIAISPDRRNVYFERGFCYNEIGEYDKAISDFNKQIELNSKEVIPYKPSFTYNSRGHAYFQKGNYANAIADFKKAVEIDPDNETAKNNLAITLRKQAGNNQS